MSSLSTQGSLPEQFKLMWYAVQTVLGRGGFGITYLARDNNLDHKVAIKEYLPIDFASRSESDATVSPLTESHQETYEWGLNNFISEAKTLAKFKHPNIVKVLSVFNELNTAYMVMEYEHGQELKQRITEGGPLNQQELLSILIPLLDGISLVHEQGFIHRDIKPGNIMIREDGSPVLIDFGSARLATGEYTKTLTAMLSYGYAPFEQYDQANDRQGPWTDIYALAATAYYAITGKKPVDSMSRVFKVLNQKDDPLEPFSEEIRKSFSPHILEAILSGMSPKTADRPSTANEWKAMLLGESIEERTVFMPSHLRPKVDTSARKLPVIAKHAKRRKRPLILGSIAAFGAVSLMTLQTLQSNDQVPATTSSLAQLESSVPASPSGPANASVPGLSPTGANSVIEGPVPPPVLLEEGALDESLLEEPESRTIAPQKEGAQIANLSPAPSPSSAKADSTSRTGASVQNSKSLDSPDQVASASKAKSIFTPPTENTTLPTANKLADSKKVVDSKKVAKTSTKSSNNKLSAQAIKAKKKPVTKKKAAPVKKEINIGEEAPIILESFIASFSSKDLKSLKKSAVMSPQKEQLASILFTQYDSISVDLFEMETMKKQQEARSQLVITQLTNKDGDHVDPSGSWSVIALHLKANAKGKLTAYWQ